MRASTQRGRNLAALLTAVGALLLLPGAASANQITVDDFEDVDLVNDPPDGDCSLREAIQAAADNMVHDGCGAGSQGPTMDTIVLETGTYEVEGLNSEEVNARGDLDIYADPASMAAGPLTIDGTGSGSVIDGIASDGNDDRVIDLQTGDLVLQDLTVRGGRSNGVGAGILAFAAGDLTLQDVTVTDNATQPANNYGGGGIYFQPAAAATLSIQDSTITGNSADQGSGVNLAVNGTLDMQDSTVSGNTISEPSFLGSVQGGGMVVGGFGGQILRSTISGNSATQAMAAASGGGLMTVMASASDTLLIGESAITGNTVSDGAGSQNPTGGGIYHASGTLLIRNSTIAGNSVVGDSVGTTGGGGGIRGGGAAMRIAHSTLAENEAPYGDAIALQGLTSPTLRSSIIDDQDMDTSDTCEYDLGAMPVSQGYNVAMGTTCVDGTDVDDLPSTDPQLEMTGLGDWGGPTQTAPPETGSPAVDLVPGADCDDGEAMPTLLTVDQRGFGRPFDGPDGDSDADCDAGAVEDYPCGGENATLVGNGSANLINGTAGVDVVHGVGGGDTINGLAGQDKLCGGDGDDVIEGGLGSDSIVGGAGADTASYANASSAASVDLGAGASTLGDGDDSISEIEHVIGSDLGDDLTGDGQDNMLTGRDGNDTLTGGGGDDDYLGGNGTDRASFEGAAGPVTANLVTGTATGEGGSEVLSGIENLTGSGNGDTLTGDGGANELVGANGGDTITGGAGPDTVLAGNGADQIFVRDGVTDQVSCGALESDPDNVEADAVGTDVISNCLAPDVVDFAPTPPNPTPTGRTGSCAGRAATVVGTAGADVLIGTAGADVIDAKAGRDVVKALGGKDVVCGAAGNDNLIGGGGNDTLNGGGGRDTLKGGTGRDKLFGAGGRDRCLGGGGRDTGRGCETRRSVP